MYGWGQMERRGLGDIFAEKMNKSRCSAAFTPGYLCSDTDAFQQLADFLLAGIQIDVQVNVSLAVQNGHAESVELNLYIIVKLIPHDLLDEP